MASAAGRAGIAVAVILSAGAVLLVTLWLRPAVSTPAPLPPPVAGDVVPPQQPADAFALTVLYVYDGDTIQAQMRSPNEIVTTDRPLRIRLIGVDTPEGTPAPECWADEARSHLAELLPEGATVWAAPDQETWDDYGRRLFNLWTDDGRFVQSELVVAGDAEAIRIQPNVLFSDELTTLQAAAQSAGRGQWGACG